MPKILEKASKGIKKFFKSKVAAWIMTATGMVLTVVGTIMIPGSRLIETSRISVSPNWGPSREIIYVTLEALKELLVAGIATTVVGISTTLAGAGRLFHLQTSALEKIKNKMEETSALKKIKKRLRAIEQQKLEAPKKTLENTNPAADKTQSSAAQNPHAKVTSSAKKIIKNNTLWEGNTVPTKGGGHCAVHAIYGKETDNFCEAVNVEKIRDDVANKIKNINKDNEFFPHKEEIIHAIKNGIKQTLLETEKESRLSKYANISNFPHLRKLREEFNNFRKESEQNKNAMIHFEDTLRLGRYQAILDYIKTQYRKGNSQSELVSLRTQLKYCLQNRNVSKRLNDKMRKQGLSDLYNQYKVNLSKKFAWGIDEETINEYLFFIGSHRDENGQGVYLYLHELEIFAYILNKRVHIYTPAKTDDSSLIQLRYIFNPTGEEEICIMHDGNAHIERLHVNNVLSHANLRNQPVGGHIPTSISDWSASGNSLFNEGKFHEAEECYLKATQGDLSALTESEITTLWFNLGNSRYYQNKYMEAEECYLKATQYDLSQNRKAILTFKLGYCYSHQNKYEEAKQAFFEATQYNPEKSSYWSALGTVLKKLGDFENARESYQKATELEPTNAVYWIDLWLSLTNLKEYKEAKHALEQAIECDPDAMSWENIDAVMAENGPEEYQNYEAAKKAYLKNIHKVILNESITSKKIHWQFVKEMNSYKLDELDNHPKYKNDVKNIRDSLDSENFRQGLRM